LSSITRRSFLGGAGAISAVAAFAGSSTGQTAQARRWVDEEIGNATFRLKLSPSQGLKQTRLTHAPSALLLADGDYSFSFGRPEFLESSISEDQAGLRVVSLRGTALGSQLEVVHDFRLPGDQPWVEEQLTLAYRG